MVRALPSRRGTVRLCLQTLSLALLVAKTVWCQQVPEDWQQRVREKVEQHQFDAAFALVNQRLSFNPADLEARGWRGRLLAWEGHWAAAESEYRQILEQAPNDTEILSGQADVLLWQGKLKEALDVIDQARKVDSRDAEILLRRARILQSLGRTPEARSQYREILELHPENQDAKRALAGLTAESKHEIRIGGDGSTLNYIGPAGDEEMYLTSRWTPRFTTAFNTGFYQRFGQRAEQLASSASFRFTRNDALAAGGAFANHQGIIPEYEAFFEYGHGLRFSSHWVRGLEASYQQHWFWYQGAHVLTLNCTQLYYLQHDWTWALSVTGARSGFTGTGIEWVPSGYARLGFPIYRNLSGDVTFGSGTEDFAQIDQIGHFSARTYAGGLKYRIAQGQDIRGYVAVQDRSAGQTQHTFGLSYGFRF